VKDIHFMGVEPVETPTADDMLIVNLSGRGDKDVSKFLIC